MVKSCSTCTMIFKTDIHEGDAQENVKAEV